MEKSKTIGAPAEGPRHEDLTQHLELQILYDISSALYSSPHLQDVLQRALANILRTLKFKMGALYLVKEASGDRWLLELAVHHGFSPTLLNCIQFLTMPSGLMARYDEQDPIRWFPISKITFAALRERMT